MVSNAQSDSKAQADPEKAGSSSPLSYNSYLKVSELKRLQVCQSDPPHHDEPLFIVIHQAYELWFKVILHEIDAVLSLLNLNKVRRATFYMRRIVAILRLLVQQIHILETMSPKDFLGFRYNLNPASGFQSSQFREIEFAGGLRHPQMLEHFRSDPKAYENLEKRYNAPSLKDAFYALLRRSGFSMPDEQPQMNDQQRQQAQDQRIRELLKIYDEQETFADIHELAETFLDFDELIFLWRTHHVTVVERIIGFKRGTGGSVGVGYLRTTLDKRCFPDLWRLRTFLEL
jgi:tryptophan 2,3-dioxygenase